MGSPIDAPAPAPARPANDEQATLWNGIAGQAWVDAQTLLDGLFEPFERMLADAASSLGARSVLDVGCGSGATTLACARRLGAQARCTGVDVSAPLLATARERAARAGSSAEFVLADAQEHAFAPAAYDTLVSRFGVMFFDDPVRAFTNLRRAATPSAQLRMLAWRSAAENPFMTVSERAVAPLIGPLSLPAPPPRAPDAPGQFAFGDPARVTRILSAAGWGEVVLERVDLPCRFAQSQLVGFFTRLGPLGRLLAGADEATRAKVVSAVQPAYDAYVRDGEVRFDAACWLIRARAPG